MRISLLLVVITVNIFSVLAQNSVLSEGSWHKISVTESGVYRISYDFLRNELNWDMSNFDPLTFKIYGNGGGGILPQKNSDFRYSDLEENSIMAVGIDDGSMDPGDYFLFYGNSPHKCFLDSDGVWECETNIYSDKNYYFLTYGGESGKRIIFLDFAEGDYPSVKSHREKIFIDENDVNIVLYGSGRTWYSELQGRNGQFQYNFPTPGATDSIYIKLDVMGVSFANAQFEVNINGQPRSTIPISRVRDDTYAIKGDDNRGYYRFPHTTDDVSIRYSIESGGETSVLLGYTDKITITYDRQISFDGNTRVIALAPSPQPSTIEGIGTSPERIWNISNPIHPQNVRIQAQSESFTFDIPGSDQQNDFIFFNDSEASLPEYEGSIQNQNIRGLSPRDGLIITHPDFLDQAERLANFHENNDGLDIAVVTTDQVFNEFGSGIPDVTAMRDATRYFYGKGSNFRYLLLFGDASYDYKNRIPNNTNLVPIYQSRESLDPVLSYCSDDYFGFMEDEEGEWFENFNGDHTLEIGVGRIPITTKEQASNVVTKIIRYSISPRLIGEWKNSVTYVVDDGDNNIHMRDAEDFSDYLYQYQPQTNIKKVYLDIYEQEVFANFETSEAAQSTLTNTINEGTFMVNYIGHGSDEQWMAENVLNRSTIRQLKNRFKLPVFVTATCEFGRIDNPNVLNSDRASSAEILLYQPDGGAIALLSTSRPVFASSNYLVNAAFHSYLYEKVNGKYLRLGDIVRLTKNGSLNGPRNRNFMLLGDPFLRLAYPQNEVVITGINGTALTSSDTLKALERIVITGEIRNESNVVNDAFDGVVSVKVLDRPTEKRTLGQESAPFTYTVEENVLFKGKATVSSGNFDIEFLLPKNISYRFQQGKIETYAWSENDSLDANGATRSIIIGGTDETTPTESTAPEVSLFFNDSSFQNGDKIGTSSIFIARIKDESGINTTGLGISQDIMLTLSNGEEYILNNYYSADIDTYKSGSVVFPINDLEPGRYTGIFKIWDIHNNLTEKTVSFIVSDKPQVRLFNVLNYPNPIENNQTSITFDHDRPGERFETKIMVYNDAGRVVGQYEYDIDETEKNVELKMDLAPLNLTPGLYFYRLIINSTPDGAVGSRIGKMIKTN